jgi:hypothetical protein
MRKSPSTILLTIIFSLTLSCCTPPQSELFEEEPTVKETEQEEIEETFDEYFERVFRTEVEYDMFPEIWKEVYDLKATALSSEKVEDRKEIIYDTLSIHPFKVLYKNLYRVYILDALIINNKNTGGTNTSKYIYLTYNVSKNAKDFYLKRITNVEFSSILFRNYSNLFDNRNGQS